MKRCIKASSIRNPIAEMPIRRAFDRLWNSAKGDKKIFVDSIAAGYGNSDLPAALWIDYDDLISQAEQYADYRQAKEMQFINKHSFDADSVIAVIEEFIDANSSWSFTVKLDSKKLHKGQIILDYYICSLEYPKIKIGDSITISPESQFRLTDEYADEILECIDLIENKCSATQWFLREYSGLLDVFYGQYLDIPKSDYKEYIICDSYYGRVDFAYTASWNLEKLLCAKGYIDEPYPSDALKFLDPLFQNYNLRVESSFYLCAYFNR